MSDSLASSDPNRWTYIDVWEATCRARPNDTLLIQGERSLTWKDFNRASNGLARRLLDVGVSQEAKVAVYMMNCPEYMIACAAAFKIGSPPFNVNYRYGQDELLYLFDNADAEAVVFHASFAEKLDSLRSRLPLVKTWVAVPSDGFQTPDWAVNFNDIAAEGADENVVAPWGRSGENALMIYTGGTTGMPKGVLWAQRDLVAWKLREGQGFDRDRYARRPEDVDDIMKDLPQQRWYIAAPLMHATGLFHALDSITYGGAVIVSELPKFKAEMTWDDVERYGVTHLSVVGEPFCMPLLEALRQFPGRWDLSRLTEIASSGAMWTIQNKRALLQFLPQCTLVDSYASSEAYGMGRSVLTVDQIHESGQTGMFKTGPSCAVFTEDGRMVEPGSDEIGMVAVSVAVPLGYYKDPEKSAKTFPCINGKRWALPGDFAKVALDGSLILLGRGSQCINTGGEKVFPEEVEECLKLHPAVRDAAVIGTPDPRFGERVAAIVELCRPVEDSELIAHVRQRLADYKAPRSFHHIESVMRSPNGKLDYKMLRRWLAERP
jgi:acyl-CoA synthetase (AMP-forming)/AMP-acid ligase II